MGDAVLAAGDNIMDAAFALDLNEHRIQCKVKQRTSLLKQVPWVNIS